MKKEIEINESHERAAIIGHCRNGATIDQIAEVTGRFSYYISVIINDYKRCLTSQARNFGQ